MPTGRYKKVASRFKQWRILPADCKSWIERRDDEPGGSDADAAAASASAAAAAAAAAAASATGRIGGDLPENVTEERLYQSRLYDLARERHKMIQESDYVRNQFIDRQMRKARSKSLGRLLQGLDIEQYRNKSASGVEKLHQKSAHTRLMVLATKLLGLSIDEISKLSEDELRLKLNIPTSAAAAAAASATAATADTEADAVEPGAAPSPPPASLLQPIVVNLPPRPLTSRTQPLWPNPPSSSQDARRGSGRPGSTATAFSASLLPRVLGGDDYRRQSSSYRARPGATAVFGSSAAGAASAQSGRPRTASARRRVQSDPRCLQLINTLTPRYRPAIRTDQDVGAIIRANPSLCQPTELLGDQDTPERRRQLQQQQQHRQKASKGRRTRREALEILDSIVRMRYYEAGNLATLG